MTGQPPKTARFYAHDKVAEVLEEVAQDFGLVNDGSVQVWLFTDGFPPNSMAISVNNIDFKKGFPLSRLDVNAVLGDVHRLKLYSVLAIESKVDSHFPSDRHHLCPTVKRQASHPCADSLSGLQSASNTSIGTGTQSSMLPTKDAKRGLHGFENPALSNSSPFNVLLQIYA